MQFLPLPILKLLEGIGSFQRCDDNKVRLLYKMCVYIFPAASLCVERRGYEHISLVASAYDILRRRYLQGTCLGTKDASAKGIFNSR